MEDREPLSPMEVYLREAKRFELAQLDELERQRLAEPKPQPKKTRPDFHGLRVIRGGRKD